MSYPMGPSNPGGYGPPPPGGYGGGSGPPPGFGPAPAPGGFGGPPPGFGGGGGDRFAAEAKVKPAAITLMVFTVIGMLMQVVGLVMNILGTGMNVANDSEASQLMSGAMGIVMNIIGLLAGGFCIFAFLKMMKLENGPLAFTAVIFSMLPCLGSCWCVNLWVGIWALIVLNDPNVKMAFRSATVRA